MMAEAEAEKRARWKESFKLYDKDGDGTVSTEELGSVLKTLGFVCEVPSIARFKIVSYSYRYDDRPRTYETWCRMWIRMIAVS